MFRKEEKVKNYLYIKETMIKWGLKWLIIIINKEDKYIPKDKYKDTYNQFSNNKKNINKEKNENNIKEQKNYEKRNSNSS